MTFSSIEIKEFDPAEWSVYKKLRIASLRDSPDAFGSTLDTALACTDEIWKARLQPNSNSLDLAIYALSKGNAVGLAWGKIRSETRSTAHLYQMWVAPEARGSGAGSLLLNRVTAWSKDLMAKQLHLSVTIGNSPAWSLYRSAGFIEVGSPEPLREGASILCQPMLLDLADATLNV